MWGPKTVIITDEISLKDLNVLPKTKHLFLNGFEPNIKKNVV